MRKALIDTNIYTAFKRNQPDIVELFRTLDYIGLDITVLAELYSGFRGGNREKKNRKEIEAFINSDRVHLLFHDADTSDFYAQIFYRLKKNGTPIPTNDIWIAAAAMQNGLAMVTLDTHFEYIEGLIRIEL